MSTEQVETAEVTEAAETTKTRGRGRPRSEATIARDERVFDALAAESRTKAGVMEATSLPANEVYLSLWRLRAEGRIERVRDGGAHVWSVVVTE